MRWTNGRGLAALLVAAGVIAGPAVAPASAADSIREQQWHLDAMKAPEMWKVSKGRGITVAVIDSGFKLDHPDLVGQFLPGKDFSGLPGGLGDDAEGHGTKMASAIIGSGKGLDGKGAYGLAPEAKVLPLKIKNGGNAGAPVPTSEFLGQISQAIVFASDQGARIISISQGVDVLTASASDESTLKNAVAHANAKGALVVASVGNSGDKGNPAEYPGALGPVLGVGAVDRDGNVTAESERGPQVDLVAPGADIYGACPTGSGYCKGHGTSSATALVSASAALVWAAHPDWNANQVARVLINTAGKPADGSGRNDLVGFGAVRPRIALTTPGDPGPADVNPLAAPAAGNSQTATQAPSGSAGTAAAPVPAPGGQQPTSAPAAQPKAEGGKESGSSLPVIAAVVGGVAVVAVVVLVLLRRRSASAARPESAPPIGPSARPLPPGHPAGPPQPQQQLPQPQQPPAYGTPPPPAYGQPPAPPSDNPYAR